MRTTLCAILFSALALVPTSPSAQEAKEIKGLYLITDYPAVTVRPGSTSTVPLKLHNYGLAPERLAVKVEGVPANWSATILGGGQPVAAAMPAPNASVSLQLRLEVPQNGETGAHTLTVLAEGQNSSVRLPIEVALAEDLPAKLSVEPKLPALRGSARSSFEYQMTIKNDSGRNVLASFAAQAPRNFETSFTEAYGSQELSSIPIEAGQSKDIKLRVRPPSTIGAGRYPMAVSVSAEDARAQTEVALEVVGQPRLRITGREGLMSGKAEAGSQTSMPIFVMNEGSAPADNIELTGSGPSGWKVEFAPKVIDRIAPGERAEVQAQVTPSVKSLAGDYVTTIRAAAQGEQASGDFRFTVSASTLWGVTGAGILAAALVIMVGAVARYGRR
jgi:uncharacterized membrane protein